MTLSIRRYEPARDRDAVLLLCQAGLGWRADEPNELLFRWKHEQNPFGPSPAWVAVDGERLVGFRAFLRWQFTVDGEVVQAVRAIDTVTHPSARGRGVFRDLTLTGLEELTAEGVSFVFNTPNDQSRPGYLKMGWRAVGQLPALVRPRSLRSMVRMSRARTPASHWSTPCDVGESIERVVPAEDRAGDGRLATRRSGDYLAWRYGAPFLAYRALSVEGGHLMFRLRSRGQALEAAVVDGFGCPGSGVDLQRLLRGTGADYALALDGPGRPSGLLPLPRSGPLLTWKGLQGQAMPDRNQWWLSLGDIELF